MKHILCCIQFLSIWLDCKKTFYTGDIHPVTLTLYTGLLHSQSCALAYRFCGKRFRFESQRFFSQLEAITLHHCQTDRRASRQSNPLMDCTQRWTHYFSIPFKESHFIVPFIYSRHYVQLTCQFTNAKAIVILDIIRCVCVCVGGWECGSFCMYVKEANKNRQGLCKGVLNLLGKTANSVTISESLDFFPYA